MLIRKFLLYKLVLSAIVVILDKGAGPETLIIKIDKKEKELMLSGLYCF